MSDDPTRTQAADTEQSSIALFFDKISTTRNDLFRSHPGLGYEQQMRAQAVLSSLNAKTGETILDIGCGNARDIVPVLKAGATVVGVDVSEGMLQQAQRELASAGYDEVRLELGDATKLAFPSEAFDKIVCSETIEHIPEADTAVSEMFRVLKVGGSLVMSTPNSRSWYGFDRYVLSGMILRRTWNHPFDNWRNMGELCSLLERHGFQITRKASVCYLPGFALSYFLPGRLLQNLLVWVVRKSEPLASRVAPWRGYTLVVTAAKNG